jgi:hypothetical protein
MRRISSFGEDNQGNLYLLSLADDVDTPYNSINEGQIFKLVAVPVWNIAGGGDYFTTGNWMSATAGVLSGVDKEVRFFSAITANSTVTANSPVTLGTVRFNDNNNYNLAGSGSLTLQVSTGTARAESLAGTQQISLPVTIASDIVLNTNLGATLKFSGPVTINTAPTSARSAAARSCTNPA